jgi:hypothetical protein
MSTKFHFYFTDSNVPGRFDRYRSRIKEIRHLHFNIHSSLLKLKSSICALSYAFFQIKMFMQDLTTITNEIKRMEMPGTSIVPPSSS